MIGQRMKKLRREKHITQSELAEQLSVSKFTISSYENNHTEPDDAAKVLIARALDVSLDYLLGLTDCPYPLSGRADAVALPVNLTAAERQLVIDFLHYLETTRPNPELVRLEKLRRGER